MVQYSRALNAAISVLALADHAQRRALHAAGRQTAAHLLPQQRRQVEADEIVERAARLLRVDQVDRTDRADCSTGLAHAVAA